MIGTTSGAVQLMKVWLGAALWGAASKPPHAAPVEQAGVVSDEETALGWVSGLVSPSGS